MSESPKNKNSRLASPWPQGKKVNISVPIRRPGNAEPKSAAEPNGNALMRSSERGMEPVELDEAKRYVETSQASFELRIAEKLRATEERSETRVRAVETKLHTIQQIALVLGALAVIFGVSGAWGYTLLREATQQLDEISKRVATLSEQTSAWEAVKERHTKQLLAISQDKLNDTRSALEFEADQTINRVKKAAESDLKRTVEDTIFAKIRARSIRVLDSTGNEVASVSLDDRGGAFRAYSAKTGKAIASLGLDTAGNLLSMYDDQGRLSLSGSSGAWHVYNPATGKEVVSLGSNYGFGLLSMYDNQGRLSLSGSSGAWHVYNPYNGKEIASLGERTKSIHELFAGTVGFGEPEEGGFLSVNDKQGRPVLKGMIIEGTGGKWGVYNHATGKEVVSLGSEDGFGLLSMYDDQGRLSLSGSSGNVLAGSSGAWHVYNPNTDKNIVTLGMDMAGGGGLWFYNKNGVLAPVK